MALLRIRVEPQLKEKLSPFEILYGRPYETNVVHSDSVALVGQNYLIDYVNQLGRKLQSIRTKVLNCQPPKLNKPFHDISPGDWVNVKSLTGDPLQERWEGPYLTLLTTHTAVKAQGKSTWLHYTRVKKAPEDRWVVSHQSPDRLKLKLTHKS